MKTIGLLYGQHTGSTAAIGKRIAELWGDKIEYVDVETARIEDIAKYDLFILGTATYFDGELPSYWDEMLPTIEGEDLSGKRVAVYGFGDQVGFPMSFADGVGLLARAFEAEGATIVGKTPREGYSYEQSEAEEGDHFLGLVLDPTNQPELTDSRLAAWLDQLRKEFA